MSNPKLNYIGPGESVSAAPPRPLWRSAWDRVPKSFIVFVVLPTLAAAIYFLLIASPLYVSEARFVVRTSGREQPSSIGLALQGVGVSTSQTDALVVHEYITSPEAVRDLSARLDIRAILARPEGDIFTRFPRPWEKATTDSLHKGVGRFVTVGYNSTNGMSTLRVKAFRPQDAEAVANALLDGGERLVNALNERSDRGAVADATRSVVEAERRLTEAQIRLTSFRTRERIIDPSRAAVENSELIGGLLSTVANLRAERAELAASAPQSPQIPALDGRIAAFERQIEIERAKVVGNSDSLASKIETYEALDLDRQYADKALAGARTALDNAELEARSQRLYLERVVSPNLPSDASQPKRWISILTVLVSLLIAYGTGWLIVAGLREHQQT